MLTCTDIGISQVYLGGSTQGSSRDDSDSPLLLEAKKQILEYLDGHRKEFDLPLDWENINGFQKEVLTVTASIPFGETLTYGQIAELLHKPAASRAVGGALAKNPLLLLIPCHRVVSAAGKLTGYAGANGIQTKQWLLEKEGHKVVGQTLV